ncbi:OLC1v1018250C2 [Oldenlandia corymbosa var. corymbosa]|uniref:OLC1v1018250C2 n=1 Tax=Oldenlandia corymbosa var. corymbosa TaxID=529605 RepID=A0AAV1EBC9_OLDCO|nr:OLC1v1018250C2 [Oldenlandia corymbosa var. corymbosa]
MQQHSDPNFYYPYPQNPIVPPPPPPAQPTAGPSQSTTFPQPPPSSASAPPFSAGNYPPPPSDYPTPYSSSYPQVPDPFSTAPPPQQPQFSASFPQYETHGSYYQQQPPPPPPPSAAAPPQSYYTTYDQQYQGPTQPNYASPGPNSTPSSKPPFDSVYSAQLNQLSSSFERNLKFDPPGNYLDDYSGRYGSSGREKSDIGSNFYGKSSGSGGGYGMDGYGDGVYAYQGSNVEPYGARGTAPKSSTWSGFDDFGRPIGYSSSDKPGRSSTGGGGGSGSTKIARAVPKVDTQEDVKSGVQKFRVKLLAESGGQSTMDVLCQIGLDGIRMLDPSSNRTLRIYPLDTITRCEVADSSTLSFWSKSSVDLEPRRIRLRSNSYTTNTLLDTVTAATVQFKEMGGRSRQAEYSKVTDQPTEKKKGFGDWMNFIKPANEEKDHWVPDEAVTKCTGCGTDFNAFLRRHHCRNCGDIFCDKCTQGRTALTADQNAPIVRVCDRCMGEVSRRLSSDKEAVGRSTSLHSHEDLAKKLQEEMERNRKSSSGSRSDSSGRRMKEVACPTCTVHLQVQSIYPFPSVLIFKPVCC